MVACFLKRACRCPQRLPQTPKRPVFVLARPTCASRALLSKPPIAFWNSLRRDCQMTGSGSNLDSNSGLPPDQGVVKVLQPPKSQHKLCGLCGVSQFFLSSLLIYILLRWAVQGMSLRKVTSLGSNLAFMHRSSREIFYVAHKCSTAAINKQCQA